MMCRDVASAHVQLLLCMLADFAAAAVAAAVYFLFHHVVPCHMYVRKDWYASTSSPSSAAVRTNASG